MNRVVTVWCLVFVDTEIHALALTNYYYIHVLKIGILKEIYKVGNLHHFMENKNELSFSLTRMAMKTICNAHWNQTDFFQKQIQDTKKPYLMLIIIVTVKRSLKQFYNIN